MDRELHDLRRELSGIERGPGRWYPPTLRERITRWTRRRRSDGASLREIGDEIGMSWETLRRWSTSTAESPPAFVPVEVVDDHRGDHALAIVTPAGYRIEGITIADAIALVRELG
jgi:hypothetical protein